MLSDYISDGLYQIKEGVSVLVSAIKGYLDPSPMFADGSGIVIESPYSEIIQTKYREEIKKLTDTIRNLNTIRTALDIPIQYIKEELREEILTKLKTDTEKINFELYTEIQKSWEE